MKKRILYIEDNEMVAFTACTLLREHGYEVEHFPLGNTGFERFTNDFLAWDVVILDLDLPDVSGWDILPKIAACRPHLPIVVFSGQKGLNDSFDIYRAGATAVLQKPFGGYELVDVIDRLLQKQVKPGA